MFFAVAEGTSQYLTNDSRVRCTVHFVIIIIIIIIIINMCKNTRFWHHGENQRFFCIRRNVTIYYE